MTHASLLAKNPRGHFVKHKMCFGEIAPFNAENDLDELTTADGRYHLIHRCYCTGCFSTIVIIKSFPKGRPDSLYGHDHSSTLIVHDHPTPHPFVPLRGHPDVPFVADDPFVCPPY